MFSGKGFSVILIFPVDSWWQLNCLIPFPFTTSVSVWWVMFPLLSSSSVAIKRMLWVKLPPWPSWQNFKKCCDVNVNDGADSQVYKLLTKHDEGVKLLNLLLVYTNRIFFFWWRVEFFCKARCMSYDVFNKFFWDDVTQMNCGYLFITFFHWEFFLIWLKTIRLFLDSNGKDGNKELLFLVTLLDILGLMIFDF